MSSPVILIRFKGKVESYDDNSLSVRVIKRPTMSHVVYPVRSPWVTEKLMSLLRDRFVGGDTINLNSPLVIGIHTAKQPRAGAVIDVTMTIGSGKLIREYEEELTRMKNIYFATPYEARPVGVTLIGLEQDLNNKYCLKARALASEIQ